MITQPQLDSWLGKSMTDICLNSHDKKDVNHCAHFVSHVLNLEFGYTCRQAGGGRYPGANLRVHEIFDRSLQKQEILQTTPELTGLVFVSERRNFRTISEVVTLTNVPRKHVGILHEGFVWHYSNPIDQVIKQLMSAFLFHYARQQNSLWYGSLPPGARPIWFGQC